MSAEKILSVSMARVDFEALRGILFTADKHENFAVALCGISETPLERRLLVREIWPAPRSAYEKRLTYHLQIAPAFFNSVVDRSLGSGLHPVIIHSHPSPGKAKYSPSDDFGEGRLIPVLSDLLPGRFPTSLLFTEDDVTGRTLTHRGFTPLDSIDIRGVRFLHYSSKPKLHRSSRASEAYDRQLLVFGKEGQHRIESLKVAIVGLGGIGSIVAEQLVRVGISDLMLVDLDHIEPSNLSRVVGSRWGDGAKHPSKVNVVAQHLKRIRGGLKVEVLKDNAIRQQVLEQLQDRDLLFGCTDNHLSRAMLNRFSHQYIVPLVDMGIRLDARQGDISAAAGRVSLVGPGMTCLRCSGHIDPERIRVESLPEAERAELEKEGYVQGIQAHVPAVISLNATIAGLAVTAGLGLIVNLVGDVPPLGQIYDATTSSIFPIIPKHEAKCDVCSSSLGLKGLGNLQIVSAYA